MDPTDYPVLRADRDRWVVRQRGARPTGTLHARQHGGWLWEEEPGPGQPPLRSLTVFLTNRECPWRCVYCDLWQHTLDVPVAPGDIPHQLETALAEAGAEPQQLKLYNAGSYFDRGAVPEIDDAVLARRIGPLQRVVVESHPRLVRDRTWRFRDLLARAGGANLEVAMGLETAHSQVLEKLNKGVSLDEFARVARTLNREGVAWRAFVLVQPPFETEADAAAWAVRSAAYAFECGARRVTLIPVRSGPGALARWQTTGVWSPPRWETVETALEGSLALGAGWVEVDGWDLDRLAGCAACRGARRERLERMSRSQRWEPRIPCPVCGAGG
ncbi:MAG: radical SAM protein [Verrucomicrobiales bacterium]|nr:radical SAM protein [Verrucomicrobiales bacterium]